MESDLRFLARFFLNFDFLPFLPVFESPCRFLPVFSFLKSDLRFQAVLIGFVLGFGGFPSNPPNPSFKSLEIRLLSDFQGSSFFDLIFARFCPFFSFLPLFRFAVLAAGWVVRFGFSPPH